MDLAGLHAAYLRHRYEVLFWSLLVTLVTAPVSAALGIHQSVIELFLAGNLFAAVAPLREKSARRTLLVLLGVVLVVRITVPPGWILGLSLTLAAILGVIAAGGALRYSLRSKSIERDHVCAALAGYLLLGLFCGHLYWAIELHAPGSIATPRGGPFGIVKAFYFSFATLTTCGFGDIVPRSDLARGLSTLEAVGGQLYLAVLVARLIGLYVGRKRT